MRSIPFNPFNQIISGGSPRAPAEFGNRLLFDQDRCNLFTTAVPRGDKLFDGNWGYDPAFRYSQVKVNFTSTLVSIPVITG